MQVKDLKTNPGVRISSRIDHGVESRTSTGDNLVGDFIATEGYDGPLIASGGTLATYTVSGVQYTSRTFTGSDSLVVKRGSKMGYAVIAGAGYQGGGGGGAGGMLDTSQNPNGIYGYKMPRKANTYTVVVGGAHADSSVGSTAQGFYLHATKGGNGPSGHGGSGGGAPSAYDSFNGPCYSGGGGIAGQGHPGGHGHCHNQCGYAPMGGGGGAGGAGAVGGAGGGRNNSLQTGVAKYYAGGGAGYCDGGPCYPCFGSAGGEYGNGPAGAGVVILAHKG